MTLLSRRFFLGLISPSHTFPHQRVHTLNNRRSVSANSELLQIKLRRLINDSSSPKDSVFDSYVLSSQQQQQHHHQQQQQKSRRPSIDLEHTKFEPPHQFSTPKRLNQEVYYYMQWLYNISIYYECEYWIQYHLKIKAGIF